MRKKNKYMVGYDSDRQTVYGGDGEYADAMTLKQAEKRLGELWSTKFQRAIYKLVSVKVLKRGEVASNKARKKKPKEGE